jgi:uncharacterized FAD-dependent dehydrogenase
MQKTISLKALPSEASDPRWIRKTLAADAGQDPEQVTGYNILRQSIDARGKTTWINLSIQAFFNEPWQQRERVPFHFRDVGRAEQQVVIVGAGPAGLFAALKLIEGGVKPIVLERGKDVRARRRDLARLNKEGILNPESNYCFGEGGAGTYSDGKLYTRSSKRGDITRVLNLFVRFGAEEKILYEAHPHIGTNKLPHIITAMREQILACGGEIHFEKKVTDFIIHEDRFSAVSCQDGDRHPANACIIATGHSARDIFELLHNRKIAIEAKPFALGVRVEHPQSLIDMAQYHCPVRSPYLPPASYSLVHQVDGKGVFSFCMCPGGIIAPASTNDNELVVNGWSPSKRNNPFANSGMVVSVDVKDAVSFFGRKAQANDPLLLMKFQQAVERAAFEAGGGRFVAPAQRLADFTRGIVSPSLPGCSYLPGIHSVSLDTVLPGFIAQRLQKAFNEFGKKIRGFMTNDAVVVATESRTSSPVRIPRDTETLEHIQVKGLYPCGEGGGYAGGIVSAAMDGERVAAQILVVLHKD